MSEALETSESQVSAFHLDEYVALLAQPGVKRVMGVQCPSDAVSSKPTARAHFGVDLQDMPTKCPHPKRTWFSQTDDAAIIKRHRPTSGTEVYSPVQNTPNSGDSEPWKPKTFVSGTLAAYPVILVRYSVAKLFHAICSITRSALGKSADTPKDTLLSQWHATATPRRCNG